MYRGFSFLTVVMLYKVAVNTELADTESLPQEDREKQASGSPWSQHFGQSFNYNLVLCVLLFKGTLFNIYCSLINIEVMDNITTTK